MRILIYLVLGGVVLGAVVYGLYLVWRAVSPPTDEVLVDARQKTPWSFIDAHAGWLVFFGVALIFMLMVLDRAQVGQTVPTDLVAPSAVNGRVVTSDRYY